MGNLATVQAIYAAFGKGDVPGILEHVSETVRWESWADNSAQRAGVPWLEARQGKQGVAEFFQALSSLAAVRDFQVLALMEGGDQVAAEVIIEFEVPGTGGHVRDEEVHLWTFDGSGKVVRVRHYADTAKHIAAAKPSGSRPRGGLSAAPGSPRGG